MDLESECSVHESVEDNELINPERLENVEEVKVENNGSCGGGDYHEHVGDEFLGDMKPNDVEASESVNSPPLTVGSPGVAVESSSPATRKGYGLKKWRRIKREFSKDGSPDIDTNKILKRGLSSAVMNSTKPKNFSVETKQKSEGSVSSTNAVVKSPGTTVDGFSMLGRNLDTGLEVGPTFAAGTDSENSEDRSSKSSTAASAPKLRSEIPAVVGFARDNNRMRSLRGKNIGNSVQRVQQVKGRTETSKKPRGEGVKIKKENSHSSMESDSRSSNFVFMQGANSVTSNGRQIGRSMNYNGENSDEAHGGDSGEQQFSKELQSGYGKESVQEFEVLSQNDLAADLSWDVKEEKSENNRSSMDQDPLLESLLTLQSAQGALEKEIQKLMEIGKEDNSIVSSEFAAVDPNILEASSSDQLHCEEIGQSTLCLEKQVISLKQNASLLESKLEESRAMLKEKEAKVIELEATLESNKTQKEKTESNIDLQQKNYHEMEAEIEGLFKQKIEAEVEYIAISRTIQKLRVAAVDQITLYEQQKSLALEQAQMLNTLEDAESMGALLKRQAEKLQGCREDIIENDEVLNLEKRICNVTSMLIIQFILLVVAFVLLLLRLSPHNAGVVPT
ncbi:WPP domain-interacting protein 1-like [Cornus florida]|uniref:WPP domain-interacting protein 1-like n=1 Tax=Cornus florida TaxID=4283 RepID=UPI0028A178D2|nr:WPP domain-interacting protein 1-like [Cornus florida]